MARNRRALLAVMLASCAPMAPSRPAEPLSPPFEGSVRCTPPRALQRDSSGVYSCPPPCDPPRGARPLQKAAASACGTLARCARSLLTTFSTPLGAVKTTVFLRTLRLG